MVIFAFVCYFCLCINHNPTLNKLILMAHLFDFVKYICHLWFFIFLYFFSFSFFSVFFFYFFPFCFFLYFLLFLVVNINFRISNMHLYIYRSFLFFRCFKISYSPLLTNQDKPSIYNQYKSMPTNRDEHIMSHQNIHHILFDILDCRKWTGHW